MRLAEIGGHPHKGILVGPLGEPATVRLRLLAATPTTPQVMNSEHWSRGDQVSDGAGPLDADTGTAPESGAITVGRAAIIGFVRVTIVGFGLIGGSIARALKSGESAAWHVSAWSRNPGPARKAAAEGFVDEASANSRGGPAGRRSCHPGGAAACVPGSAGPLGGPASSACGRRTAPITDVASAKA